MNDKQIIISGKYIGKCMLDGFVNGLVSGTVVRFIPQLRVPVILVSVGVGVYQYVKNTEQYMDDISSAM